MSSDEPTEASMSAAARWAMAVRSDMCVSRCLEIPVPLAEPVYAQALRYTKLVDEQRLDEAILIYMRNGSYKILSPEEDRYGSYVATTDVMAGPTEVSFISWPNADWGDYVTWHTLTFDTDAGAFRHELRLPIDATAKYHVGFAASISADRLRPNDGWEVLRPRFTVVFDALAERAGSGFTVMAPRTSMRSGPFAPPPPARAESAM